MSIRAPTCPYLQLQITLSLAGGAVKPQKDGMDGSTEAMTPAPRRRMRAAPGVPWAVGPLHAGESIERQIYGMIRRAIMAGSLPPGASLTSRSIARALAVSPTPVVQALKRLEAEDILAGRDRSAFYLAPLTRERFAELLAIRLRLEGLAARGAAERMTTGELRRLRQVQQRLERGFLEGRPDLALNFAIHFGVYRSAESPALTALIETLWVRIGPILALCQDRYSFDQTHIHHATLFEAIERREPDAAEAALRADLLAAAQTIEAQLRG